MQGQRSELIFASREEQGNLLPDATSMELVRSNRTDAQGTKKESRCLGKR